MTKEDAIKTLKELWRETNDPWYEEVYNMAINALEADRKTEPQMDELQFAKQCHKPSSLYYRCYCDERKEDEYCNGCRFWYESQTERITE